MLTLSSALKGELETRLPENSEPSSFSPCFLRDVGWIIDSDCKINITFISSVTNCYNTWGYFIYDSTNPPKNWKDIEDLIVVFPNATEVDVVIGGGLDIGDTMQLVYQYDVNVDSLGRNCVVPKNVTFPEGTGIGFFIFRDSWDTEVNSLKDADSFSKYFSLHELNSEESVEVENHRFMCFDSSSSSSGVFITAEDNAINPTTGDYNDIVVFASFDPFTALRKNTFCHHQDGTGPQSRFIHVYKKVYVDNNNGTVSEAVATLRIPHNADTRPNLPNYCNSKCRTKPG